MAHALPASVRNEAVVHVQVDESGVVDAHTHRGDPVHPETAKRILCDARVQGMLGDITGPIGVGRRTRSINRRSGGRCEWKGCDERADVEAHHIKAWVDGGELRDAPPLAHVPVLPPVEDERIVPLWRGEPLDLAPAVDVVLDKVGAG